MNTRPFQRSIQLYQNEILTSIYAQGGLNGDKIAIRELGGRSISYRDFVSSVETIAINLVQLGFQRGDSALILIRPCISTLQIVLALVRVGAVLVIADPAMGQAVFEDRMALAKPKWLFAESIILLLQKSSFLRRLVKMRGVEIPEMGAITIPHCVSVGPIPFLSSLSMRDLQKAVKVEVKDTWRDEDEDISIVFTSGTTGQPKGVVHTLRSMLATLRRIQEHLKLRDADVIYDTGILFILPALMQGATVIMNTKAFSPKTNVEAYRKYGVTKTLEVPTRMQEIARYLNQRQEKLPASLDDLMLGAAPVLPDFLRQLQAVTDASTRIWSVYGMTELLPASLVSIEEKLAFDSNGGDLVGHLMGGLTAGLAEDSELLLSGEGLFNRYLGQASIKQHPTGDMARIDEQKRIILLGRKKDMIIKGQHNIYPPLFEPSIRAIKGVVDCALVGVYNPEKADEEIVLFVEASGEKAADLDKFRKEIQAQLLTGKASIDVYAQPDYIFFTALPYSGRSRKLDKKALQALARQLLNLSLRTKL